MRRVLTLFVSVLLVTFVTAAPALAADAAEAAEAAANDGFYVEPGSSISQSEAGELVAELRDLGEGFVLVVLSEDPAAGAATFADSVEAILGRGIVLVIAPESLGLAGNGDLFNEVELERAVDAAVDTEGSDSDLARAFVSQLTGSSLVTPTTPAPVPTTVAAQAPTTPQPVDEGGGGGFVWILLLGGAALFLWWMMRRAKAKASAKAEQMNSPNLTKARYVIQEQLNDVANDILEMEDEVRVADNSRADDFYKQAGKTYNDVSEALSKTRSTEGLLNLSNKLDVAIWQLDSAEAILDDKPLPARPEPKEIEMPPPPGRAPSRRQRTPPPPRTKTTVPGPSSTYQRRPTRRSSPGGGGLMDLLIMVGGSMLNSRRRRPSSSSRGGGGLGGGLGDLFGRRRQQPSRQPSGRVSPPPSSRQPSSSQPSSSRRSNPVPGPGRPATPSQKRSQAPQESRKRGTSGRVRIGRKRRKR